MKRFFLTSLLIFFVLVIPNSVLAATTYLDQNDQTLTAQTTIPFPTTTGTVELGIPGQTINYLIEQNEVGSLDTIYVVNGNVNLILNHGFTNYQEASAYLTISGQFQVPGNASLSFYRSEITSSQTTLVINSSSTAITGSTASNSMGEINFVSTSICVDAMNSDNTIIGPLANQTGGVINVVGGSLQVYNRSSNYTSNIFGTNGTDDCFINLNSNCSLWIRGLMGGSTTPGNGNNYNVSIKDNTNLYTYGIGVLTNVPTSNPDSSPVNGLVTLVDGDNSSTTAFGTTVINESGAFLNNETLTIPKDAVLTVPEDITISIEDNVVLTVNGTLINNGGITFINYSTVLGNGTIENNQEILSCNKTLEDFDGSIVNNFEFYNTDEEDFKLPANFSGNSNKNISYYAYGSLPNTATTTYQITPLSDPNNLKVDIYNPDFGWINDENLISAEIITDEATKTPYIQIEVNNAYINNPYWDFSPFYFYINEVNSNNYIRLNSFYMFNITDMEAEPIYLAPLSRVKLSKNSSYSIFQLNANNVGATDLGSTMDVSSYKFMSPYIFCLKDSTGQTQKFYQVTPIPIDLNFVTPISDTNTLSMNFPATQASYQVTAENTNPNSDGWSINSIIYKTDTIKNNSLLGTQDSLLATLSNVTHSGEQFTLNTTGALGASSLTFTVEYNGPDGIGTITNSGGFYLGIGAVDLTGLSFGPGSQNDLEPVELIESQTPGNIYYGQLLTLFQTENPDIDIYAQSPINGKTDNVINFDLYDRATNNDYDRQDALANGDLVFKSTNSNIIDFNPETLSFEFKGETGTANIYIENANGDLSSLNAPEDQIKYLPVTVEGDVPVEEINLSTDSIYLTTLSEGTTSATLTYHTIPVNASGTPTWTSSTPQVATVQEGPNNTAIVQAVAQGTTFITCTIGDVSGTAAVIVSDDDVVCDLVEIKSNGSPDSFNVIARGVRANPALNLTGKVQQVSMFAWSMMTELYQSDINAKLMNQIPGTSDWIISNIPVNGNTYNNFFYDADQIQLHIYGSLEAGNNGNIIAVDKYSWVGDLDTDATIEYIGCIDGEGLVKPTISSGIIGTVGENKCLIGVRVSSVIEDLGIQTDFKLQDNPYWLNVDGEDGQFVGPMYYNDSTGYLTPYFVPDSFNNVEAYRFSLTGPLANNYEIQYRAHVENLGWLDWQSTGTSDGIAGTVDQGLHIEALCLKLVPVGTPLPDSSTF